MSGFLAQKMRPCSVLEPGDQQRVWPDTALRFLPPPFASPQPHHTVHPQVVHLCCCPCPQRPPHDACFLPTISFPVPITTFSLF